VNITRKNGRPKKYADSVGNKDHTAYMRWWRAKTGKKYRQDRRNRVRTPAKTVLMIEPIKFQSETLNALENELAQIEAKAKGA
jgi:hypothetical protein